MFPMLKIFATSFLKQNFREEQPQTTKCTRKEKPGVQIRLSCIKKNASAQ